MLKNAKTTDALVSEDGSTELLAKGAEITSENLSKIPFELIGYLPLQAELEEKLSEYCADIRNRINRVRQKTTDEIAKLHRGDELPPGVIKKVTVYVRRRENEIVLLIVDDGEGFDTNKRQKGIGLKNMGINGWKII